MRGGFQAFNPRIIDWNRMCAMSLHFILKGRNNINSRIPNAGHNDRDSIVEHIPFEGVRKSDEPLKYD
jgi:hypothetical protein